MKSILMILIAIALVACNSPSGIYLTNKDGSITAIIEPAQLGGKRTAAYNINPRTGAVKAMISQNNENSFDSFVASAALYGGAALATKEVLADTAAVVTNNKTAAGLTKFGIGEETKRIGIGAGLSKHAIDKGVTVIPR